MSGYSDGEIPQIGRPLESTASESIRVKRRRIKQRGTPVGRRQQRIEGLNRWGRRFQECPERFVVEFHRSEQYNRWRHRQILVVNNPTLDKQLNRKVTKEFRRLGFQVYDHMFPFRLAGGMIGRYGSHRCKMAPLIESKSRNDFEQCLADFADEYMREKHGAEFKYAFQAFENWMASSANSTQDIIVCGMLPEEYQPIVEKYNAEIVDATMANNNLQAFREHIWNLQENHARVYK